MVTICFSTRKGGTGKTTSTHAVGAALKRLGFRTLLVDLDPQANLTTSCGVNPDGLTRSVGTFLLGQSTFEQTVHHLEGYDLLPASYELINQEDSIKGAAAFPFNVRKALEKIQKGYDFVVLDTPPALGGLTRIALVACDYYFVPLEAEFLSYEGLRYLLEFASDLQSISGRTRLGGVFATRYNPNIRKRLSQDLVQQAGQQLNGQFLKTYIRENIALSEAQAMGQDIFSYAPESKAAEDYYQLTQEIIAKTNGQAKGK